jgi:hypothetical protein
VTGKSHAISVRARLLDRARRDGEDFQRLLVRYAIERLLYRLSVTPHAEDFVLKGATLFALWLGRPHRATRDLDLLGRGSPDVGRLMEAFRAITEVECCSVPRPPTTPRARLGRVEPHFATIKASLDVDD